MNRAYSTFEIKSVDDEKRIIEGVASTPSTDRMGDIVEPEGAEFTLPIPLLWQHRADQPIGHVVSATISKAGIKIRAQLAKVDEPGKLKDRLDEAWQSMRAKLVRGLSIGFDPTESARIEGTFGFRFTKWSWLELSAVTIPANAEASIHSIKSIDAQDLAASGKGQEPVTPKSAGVSALVVRASKGAGTMTYTERIQTFVDDRAASQARRDAIQAKASDEGRGKDEAEREEFDTLTARIKSIDGELVDLRMMEAEQKAAAVPVNGQTQKAGSESRGGHVISVKSNLPPGTGFTRYVMALAAAKGSRLEAMQFAKRWERDSPEVGMVLKAAVDAGTTTDATWAAPLVVYNNMASEFIELLRESTIIGRINGFRRVPFNVTMPRQTSGSTVGWVGQGAPKPVSELAFDSVSLGMAKAAGIVVVSEELARSSAPSAEAVIRADLQAAITKFLDTQFIDPSVAAVSNVSPAAVTNGASVIDATGLTAAHLRADFAAALAVWTAADMSIAGGVVLMTETQAIRLGMVVNAFGQAEFPGLTATGGTLFGLPVITSENIPAEGGSPAGNRIILLKPSEIFMADEGGIAIDVSREASVQMNSTPDNPASASTVYTSFWQNNLVGIRAERFINWLKRRSAAAVVIEGAVYTG